MELCGLTPDLVERRLQRRVELDVVEGEADLAGKLGEHAVLLLTEVITVPRPFGDDEAEHFTGVGDGRHPHLALRSTREEGRQPDGEPGVAGDTSSGHHRQLLGPDRQVTLALVGHRDRSLQHPSGPGPDLCTAQTHGLAQRFDELEEELVHGDGAGQASSEGPQDLIGGRPLPVDEPVGGLGQSVASRHVEDGGDGGSHHGEHEQVTLLLAPHLPEAEDDHQVHADDDGGEAGDRDGVDEQPVDPGDEPG